MPPAQPPLADRQRGRAIREADRRFIRVFVGTHRRILAATQPLWVRNIAACPEVTVRRGKRTAAFRARILPDGERASCWPKLSGAYLAYDKMQAKTDRPLPVIALEHVP